MLFRRIVNAVSAHLVYFLLSACSSPGSSNIESPILQISPAVQLTENTALSTYICRQADRYKSTVVGTGHCVSLIQECTGAPLTRYWHEGQAVRGASIETGTVIATFKNGHYPNKSGWHAAIYISQDKQGIWVWDQWIGKPVHKRLIRFKNGIGTANNDGDAYSVVK